MKLKFILILIFGLSEALKEIEGPQNGLIVPTVAREEIKVVPYCFRFTWLGPKYNAESQFKNETCKSLLGKTTGVPCFQPLVVSSKEKSKSKIN